MIGKVESGAKRVVRAVLAQRFHAQHAAQAATVLNHIESRMGKTSAHDLKLADAYARDVLGHSRYAPWLKVYAAVARTFKDGWIPDNYYGAVVVPRMKGLYGKLSNLKAMTNVTFNSSAFPDLAYFVNGLFITHDGQPLAQEAVRDYLFSAAREVVFKIDNSLQGKGVYFFDTQTFDLNTIGLLGNGVFQSYIVQHELLDRFAPDSVATIRITTVVECSGSITARGSYLRLGRAGDTHVQSRSHIRIPVGIADGALAEYGYSPDWLPVQAHPDSNIPFGGAKVPAFRQCIDTVVDLHRKVPFARCIGWDLSVDRDDKVRVMEWNAEHNDIKFSEATQGPCFANLSWEKLWR